MNLSIHSGLTIAGQTLRALRRYPDRIAFSSETATLSYAGAIDLIGRIQSVFSRGGLKRGERVALLSENSAESWCTAVAAQGLGLSVTWLHPKSSLADHCFQVEDSESAAIVISPATHAERGRELAAKCGRAVKLFSLGSFDAAPDLLQLAADSGATTAVDLAEPDDIALVHYTGGTTGRSKGAVRSNRNAVAFACVSVLADIELPELPHYLAIAPNSHAGGTMLLPTWHRGGTVHTVSKFEPDRIFNAIEKRRINITFLVPTMLYALLDQLETAQNDIGSLQCIYYGAAPASPQRLQQAIDRLGPILSQGYGQTECYPISVLRRQDHLVPELLTSCGLPVANCEVRLLDGAGQEVPVGEPGEICARTPAAMDFYWRQPELSAETLRDGWVHTGDVARMNERGYMFIVDRKKDLIISGGFNVYPREVEDALTKCPGVKMAAVVGLPDNYWGETVAAAVIVDPGSDISKETIIAHVKALKGAIYAPKHLHIVAELPVTSLGKIDKVRLRQNLMANHAG
jgi:fatty-acyl-CoA synthase